MDADDVCQLKELTTEGEGRRQWMSPLTFSHQEGQNKDFAF